MEIRGRNGDNSINHSSVAKWSPYIWGWGDLNSSSTILEFDNNGSIYETDATATTEANTSLGHEAFWIPHGGSEDYHSLYCGDGAHVHPDSHLMFLKLGKRHYFEDAAAAATATAASGHLGERHVLMGAAGKRGRKPSCLYRSAGGPSESSSTPRCQVEGCHMALGNAKEYHRRHKVCEMHSKAPKVFVYGLEQRFCQQCSRFHVVSEFDYSKRSCRRRLAGHNERRRKSFNDSIPRNSLQYDDRSMGSRIFPYIPSPTGRALSLLSSDYSNNWATSQSQVCPISPSDDLSSRSSAALRELIAENRAATAFIHSKHHQEQQEWVPYSNIQGFMEFNNGHEQPEMDHSIMYPCDHIWDRSFHENNDGHLTLELMQGKSNQEDHDSTPFWNSFQN